MNTYKKLQQAITQQSLTEEKALLNAHPECLSTPVDGCNRADSSCEAAWLGMEPQTHLARKNDLVTLYKLIDHWENNKAIIDAVVQHNPSTLQYFDEYDRPLLAYFIYQGSDNEVCELS